MLENEILFEIRLKVQMMNYRKATKDGKIKKKKEIIYMKNKNENIDIKLKEKVEREFNNFRNKLKIKSKEEIINSAYEIVSKEEIKNILEFIDLHPKEKQALIKDNDLLNEFYHDWLDADSQFGEIMVDSMIETVGFITRHQIKNQNER